MAYRLALGTGFRTQELRSLTPAAFDLDATPPTVAVAAARSKRRRNDTQPIWRDLAEILRSSLAGRSQGERQFAKLPQNTARMMRSDLRAARKAWIAAASDGRERIARAESDFLLYRNEAGAVVDFHATRHMYVSALVSGGASVNVAQELARHSSPMLTVGLYSHTRFHDLEGALESLPSLDGRPATAVEVLRATGTDDRIRLAAESAQRQAQHFGRESMRIHATGEELGDLTPKLVDRRTSLKAEGLSDTLRVPAKPCEKYPHGESNPGFRTENPTSWATRRWGQNDLARPDAARHQIGAAAAGRPSILATIGRPL